MIRYPGNPPQNLPSSNTSPSGTLFSNPIVDDVKKLLIALPNSGQFCTALYPSGTFPRHRFSKTFFLNSSNSGKNHFQGFQRLRDGKHFVASASDVTDKRATLIMFKIESHVDLGLNSMGPIRSNLIYEQSFAKDNLVKIFNLNQGMDDYWHPGGIHILGDILTVPLEDSKNTKSKIEFYNFRDPLNPKKYNFDIPNNGLKFGSATTVRMNNGHFLCCAFTDSGVPDPLFTFYKSVDTNFENGFNPIPVRQIKYSGVLNENFKTNGLQSIQFIAERGGNIYLVGTQNDLKATPTFSGNNHIVLFQLKFRSSPFPNFDLVQFGSRITIPNQKKYSNFGAGAGVYIESPKRLAIYNIHHWIADGKMRFTEFYEKEDRNSAKSNAISDSFLELYEKKDYSGRSLILYGSDIKAIPSFSDIKSQNKNFMAKTSSIRFRLPEGQKYRLYEKVNFESIPDNQGNTPNYLTLVGTGKIQEMADLKDIQISGLRLPGIHMNNKIRSSRFVS